MFRRSDDILLRTKIVATLGRPRGQIYDPKGDRIDAFSSEEDFWDTFLNWFFEDSIYLIDTFRLNMAFFKPEIQKELRIINWLKKNKEKLKNVALLGDLPGPKLRVSDVKDPMEFRKGDSFKLHLHRRRTQGDGCICVYDRALADEHRSIAGELRAFSGPLIISIGDGKVVLEVQRGGISQDSLLCVAKKDGTIEDGQGLTFKGVPLNLRAFQIEDQRAIDFLVEHGIDWDEEPTDPASIGSFLACIGVSFVKTAEDIINVKRYVEQKIVDKLKQREPNHSDPELREKAELISPAVIAKIETREAVENIDEILDAADGAMVARGDLALQLGPEEVPSIQKRLIRLCNVRGKPVITATQMLASMDENPEPTRAEANDVFNAIVDGTDAVMLSDETAKGRYPFQAVKMMAKIAEAAEKHFENFGSPTPVDTTERRQLNEQRFQQVLRGSEAEVRRANDRLSAALTRAVAMRDKWLIDFYVEKLEKSSKQGITDRVSLSACIMSNSGDRYKAIIAGSASGRTARMLSRFRPDVKIIGAAHDAINRRKMLISFGVYPINCGRVAAETGRPFQNAEEMFRSCCSTSKQGECVNSGDTVVFTAGVPLFISGTTNLIAIKTVE